MPEHIRKNFTIDFYQEVNWFLDVGLLWAPIRLPSSRAVVFEGEYPRY